MPKIQYIDNPVYIGIDPGNAGGIAVINGKSVFAEPMPATPLDVWGLLQHILEQVPNHEFYAMIEDVHSMPKQGVKSMFTFGKNVGMLHMALTAAEIPFSVVTPQRWMKGLHITGTRKSLGNQWKKMLLQRAQRLFPKLPNWKVPKSQGKQESVADALLIAEYCRLTHVH